MSAGSSLKDRNYKQKSKETRKQFPAFFSMVGKAIRSAGRNRRKGEESLSVTQKQKLDNGSRGNQNSLLHLLLFFFFLLLLGGGGGDPSFWFPGEINPHTRGVLIGGLSLSFLTMPKGSRANPSTTRDGIWVRKVATVRPESGSLGRFGTWRQGRALAWRRDGPRKKKGVIVSDLGVPNVASSKERCLCFALRFFSIPASVV